MLCKKHFSTATLHACYRQKKRNKNAAINKLLPSGVSQRQIARLHNINRKTVARRLPFLGDQARFKLEFENRTKPVAQVVEFDDLETFEHTKCKPLSVTLAVESSTRRILGFEVSQMPPKGHLAKISYKKYGPRKDLREYGRNRLFSELTSLADPQALIRSDSNPHYPATVKRFFPLAKHETHLSRRSSVTGQGELKKVKFDPLFSLNHTYAMFRASMNRLMRKNWGTTKKPERLADHLAIYAAYHNEELEKRRQPKRPRPAQQA